MAIISPHGNNAHTAQRYSQIDFDRENAAFQELHLDDRSAVTRHFSTAVYKAADYNMALCNLRISNPTTMGKNASVSCTHAAIKALNSLLLNPEHLAIRNPGLILQEISQIPLANIPEHHNSDFRAELRTRAINVFFKFYAAERSALTAHLVHTHHAENDVEATALLTRNLSCGNLVDAIACQMYRLLTEWLTQQDHITHLPATE